MVLAAAATAARMKMAGVLEVRWANGEAMSVLNKLLITT